MAHLATLILGPRNIFLALDLNPHNSLTPLASFSCCPILNNFGLFCPKCIRHILQHGTLGDIEPWPKEHHPDMMAAWRTSISMQLYGAPFFYYREPSRIHRKSKHVLEVFNFPIQGAKVQLSLNSAQPEKILSQAITGSPPVLWISEPAKNRQY